MALMSIGLKSVPASLTLGGYDANRFEPHDVSFDLSPDQAPEVSLNEITVTAAPLATSNVSTGWQDESITLLGPADAALYIIDSSTPYLWFPESICNQFAKAFNLSYDEDVQLYTFGSDSSPHETLINWNLTFNFIIADLPGSPKTVSLSLPYDAFDLQLSYPFPGLNATQSSTPTKYFPLRKADNNTQYTIGRVFLQETYLLVDYERSNFSVYQASFAANALTNTNLVDITRSENTTFSGPKPPVHKGLSKGAIAGIAVGAATAAVLIAAVFLCVCVRRHRNKPMDEKQQKPVPHRSNSFLAKVSNWLLGSPKTERPSEVDGSVRYPNEASTEGALTELPASTPIELPGSEVELTPYEAAERKIRQTIISPADHNPQKPVELQHRTSTAGFYGPEPPQQPSPRSLVPYSANHVGRRNTQTTGVSSRSVRTSQDSSRVSSPMVISPVTPNQVSPMMPSLAHIARRDQWAHPNESDRSSLSDFGTGEYPRTPQSPRGGGYHESNPSPLPSPRTISSEGPR